MKQSDSNWYTKDRAEALAFVFLTRRNDISIRRSNVEAETGIDIFADISKNNKSKNRTLAIQIRARVSPFKKAHTTSLTTRETAIIEFANEIPFPVCLFFFTMQDEGSYYKWILEPFRNGEGQPKLRPHTSRVLEKLDDAVLDRIVTQVNLWYDALFQALAA